MRTRRHTRTSPPQPRVRSAAWRRFVRDIGLVILTFVVGYGVAALWLSPSPVLGASEHAIPRVLGLPEAEAKSRLAALGFRPRTDGARAHVAVPAGAVIWQDPPPGVIAPPNQIILLTLSSGAMRVPVPDVVGLDSATAGKVLTAAGIRVGNVRLVSGGAEPGVVLATQPGAGTGRARGAAVDLVVGRGPGGSL